MTTFDRREQAFEAKFAHDAELHFKVVNRRNKLLGLWAAERLGTPAEKIEAYAASVVMADFEKPGDADVLQKVLADLLGANIEITAAELRAQMEALLPLAYAQVMAE